MGEGGTEGRTEGERGYATLMGYFLERLNSILGYVLTQLP